MNILGVLLAGGRSQRMGGGDKCLTLFGGKPLLVHAAARLDPQVDRLVLSANGDPTRFASFGFPVVADADGGATGPLAGILAGLDWARANASSARWIATVAADTPFVPHDLVARLVAASDDGATIRLAASNGRSHPVIGLWPTDAGEDLSGWLATGKSKAVRDWVASRSWVSVEFDASGGFDPFVNINTPDDLATAQSLFAEVQTVTPS